MKKNLGVLLLFTALLFSLDIYGQNVYPKDYFRPPVDFTIVLSGTFGELRSGHFHSGMDIKTGGVTGKKIYAVADGYVSRIKVSATGFGKTLYITHPNGYTSVYAHLKGYNTAIATYVKEKHYIYESFELNIFPEQDELPVKKGEVVAYSGNTGSSGGPHLHFEMRLTATQTPVNPLLFGFDVKDYITPEISWMKVIPAGPGTLIDGKTKAKVYRVDGWGENHRIKDDDTISVSGNFSLAISTIDKLNDASNKNGVYGIKLYVDGEQVYDLSFEKFDFVETRYINSLIDYEEYVDHKRRYQRTEIDPNNKLSIYGDVQNRGIIGFVDDAFHDLKYEVVDYRGNVSSLSFVIQSIAEEHTIIVDQHPAGSVYFSIDKENRFSAENINITLPGSCLYRDMWFEYSTKEMPAHAYSRIHGIHSDVVPLHKSFTVWVTPDSVPDVPKDKLLLARVNEHGDYISYGGSWKDGAIMANIRTFGDYTILADTVPPEIIQQNISTGRIAANRKTVKIKIKDDLSGIKHFRATLNGSWVLMEYDAKNALLVYNIDDRLKKGENQFYLEVTDQCDNKAVFEKTLTRY